MTASIATGLLSLADPCAVWGTAGGSVTIAKGAGCSSIVSTSQTIPQFLLMMAIVRGGILAGAFVGLLGILRSRPAFLIAGFVLLTLESVPLLFDWLFLFTLLPAGIFLLSARTKLLSAS